MDWARPRIVKPRGRHGTLSRSSVIAAPTTTGASAGHAHERTHLRPSVRRRVPPSSTRADHRRADAHLGVVLRRRSRLQGQETSSTSTSWTTPRSRSAGTSARRRSASTDRLAPGDLPGRRPDRPRRRRATLRVNGSGETIEHRRGDAAAAGRPHDEHACLDHGEIDNEQTRRHRRAAREAFHSRGGDTGPRIDDFGQPGGDSPRRPSENLARSRRVRDR